MHAKYTKPQRALENAVRDKRLSQCARRYLIHLLARDLRVAVAFKPMADSKLPAHEALAFAALDKLRFNLVAAVEASRTGVEGRICLLRDMCGHLAIS